MEEVEVRVFFTSILKSGSDTALILNHVSTNSHLNAKTFRPRITRETCTRQTGFFILILVLYNYASCNNPSHCFQASITFCQTYFDKKMNCKSLKSVLLKLKALFAHNTPIQNVSLFWDYRKLVETLHVVSQFKTAIYFILIQGHLAHK